MANRIPSFLLAPSPPAPLKQDPRKVKASFLTKGIDRLAAVIKKEYLQGRERSGHGLLQKVDARVKVLFLLFFVIIVSLKREPMPEAYIWIFIFGLACLSRLKLWMLYRKVFFLGFIFGFLIAFPSAFNVITRGEIITPLVRLSRPYSFWIYQIPAEIGITKEGMDGVALLTLRVINSLSLSFLVLYTTPLPEMVRALKFLRVPDSFLIILLLCHKYIVLFLKSVENMYLAKRSRMIREDSPRKAREWIAGRLATLFRKTHRRGEDVFQAMVSRGFSDSVKIYGGRELRLWDGVAGLSLLLIGIFFLWI